jgi:hypothetical protein
MENKSGVGTGDRGCSSTPGTKLGAHRRAKRKVVKMVSSEVEIS